MVTHYMSPVYNYVICSAEPSASRLMFESEAKYVQTLTVYGKRTHVCMYVCMYILLCTVCTHVHMYECMYTRKHACIIVTSLLPSFLLE
jgi:hypothetical protein